MEKLFFFSQKRKNQEIYGLKKFRIFDYNNPIYNTDFFKKEINFKTLLL